MLQTIFKILSTLFSTFLKYPIDNKTGQKTIKKELKCPGFTKQSFVKPNFIYP